MTEITPDPTNEEESLADTEAELVEVLKSRNGGSDEPLSDTEPDSGEVQEGDQGA